MKLATTFDNLNPNVTIDRPLEEISLLSRERERLKIQSNHMANHNLPCRYQFRVDKEVFAVSHSFSCAWTRLVPEAVIISYVNHCALTRWPKDQKHSLIAIDALFMKDAWISSLTINRISLSKDKTSFTNKFCHSFRNFILFC